MCTDKCSNSGHVLHVLHTGKCIFVEWLHIQRQSVCTLRGYAKQVNCLCSMALAFYAAPVWAVELKFQ